MKTGVNVTFRIPVWLDFIFTWPLMQYRKRKYGEAFRRIYLGDGEWTILDVKDYYKVQHLKWFLGGYSKKFYAYRTIKVDETQTKMVLMHRELMNAPQGILVDHKFGDSLDNRRSNLRFATKSQNVWNRGKTGAKTSSKYVGVFYDKERGLYGAQIKYEYKLIKLGRFATETEAARVYDAAAKKYFGEFAHLNLPEESGKAIRKKINRNKCWF